MGSFDIERSGLGGTSRLQSMAAAARDYLARNRSASAAAPLGRTSRFWRDVLDDRPNMPGLNEFLAFRRSSFGYGIGDDRAADAAAEAAQARRMACMIDQFVPRPFLENLVEPSYGAPLVYDFDGLPFSASFRVNAGTTYRICELLRRFRTRQQPLRVCEIGPGWGGCAVQLHQRMDIAAYVLVDLPENLFLSSTYLGMTLPDRTLEFVDVAGPPYTPSADKRIIAMLPGAIDRLACRFDLIVNSFSFQEMEADTVNAYLQWAQRSLADDGLLISFNAHGKAGIGSSAEYRFGRFKVHHLGTFRRIPSGLFNTIPYEIVLSRRGAGGPKFDEDAFATLGDLIQLGLDEDLAEYREALVAGALTKWQKSLLDALGRCLTASTDEAREAALIAAEALDDSAITPFLRGNLHFAAGAFEAAETSLALAEARGLDGFAKLRGDLMRAVIAARHRRDRTQRRVHLPDDPSIDAAFVYPEISTLVEAADARSIQGHIARILRIDPPSVPARRSLWRRTKRSGKVVGR